LIRWKEARGGGWVRSDGGEAGGELSSSSPLGEGGDDDDDADGGKAWCRWMGWSVLAVRRTWVDGCSSAKYGQGAMALVGSGRARVLWAVSSTGDCRGSRRLSGSTKVQIRFEKEDVKRVVPSADLAVVNLLLFKVGNE
jgi:hypothetical protein